MPLLNYTTTVDAGKTLAEIQKCLVGHGAREVVFGYDAKRNPVSVSFSVPTAFGERAFRLPADLGAVLATLREQQRRGKVPPRYVTEAQAARIGWRILKDWIESQMAIVESGMVGLDEVMLPYMLSGKGRTVYEVLKEQHLALSPPPPA
jgi:hypothetical protein